MNIINPTTIYPGCIEVYENAWNNPADTIQQIETDCSQGGMSWIRAEVQSHSGYKDIDAVRTNVELCVTRHAELGNRFAQKLHNKISECMVPITQSYMYKYRILGIPYHHEWFNVLKYSDDQYFDAHVDGTPGSPRFLSCVLYLNDDYEGGELEFVNYNVKIKAKAGTLVVFPSGFAHAHIAHPVTKGTKYAVVSWLVYGEMP